MPAFASLLTIVATCNWQAVAFASIFTLIAAHYTQEAVCGHHNRWARRAFLLAAGAYAVVAARYALGAG